MNCSTPAFTVLYYLPECAQTHVHWTADAIQPSYPYPYLPLLPLPSIFPSIKVFSSESALGIRWPKYWSFSISPSNECSGLISFGIDWFDLLAVQGTLKSLLQNHSLKASILRHSALFVVQLWVDLSLSCIRCLSLPRGAVPEAGFLPDKAATWSSPVWARTLTLLHACRLPPPGVPWEPLHIVNEQFK